MKYADPARCPQCRTAFHAPHEATAEASAPAICASCGLHLQTPEAFQLWTTLQSADTWLDKARLATNGAVASVPVPAHDTGELPVYADAAVPFAPVKSRPKLDTGTLLLMLGAIFILVAGGILSFLTLGVFALPFMAALSGGLAFFADKKGLKSSTETMLGLTGALGAIAVGIVAWDSLPGVVVWSLLGIAFSLGFVELTRGHRNYLVPRVFAGLYVAPLSLALADIVGNTFPPDKPSVDYAFIVGLAALIPAAGFTFLFFKRKVNIAWQISGATVLMAALYSWAAAWSVLFRYAAPREVVLQGFGAPMLIVTCALVAVAYFVPARFKLIRPLTLSLALLHAFMLTWLPIVNYSEQLATIFAFAAAVTCASFADENWRERGLRWGSFAPLTMALLFYLGMVLEQAEKIADQLYLASHSPWYLRMGTFNEDWYLFVLAAFAIVAYAALTLRWAEIQPVKSTMKLLTVTVGVVQLPLFMLFLEPNVPMLSGSFILAGIGAALLLRRLHPVALALLVLAPLVASLHAGVMAVMLGVSAAAIFALLILFRRVASSTTKDVAIGFGLLEAMALLPVAGVQLRWDEKPHVLIIAICAVAGLAALTVLHHKLSWPRRAGEVAVGLVGLSALLMSFTDTNLAWQALIAVVVGVPFVAIGIYDDHRSWHRWIGSGLLGLAWVLRLLASEVSTPEAYAAPFVVVLLAVGAFALWRRPEISSFRALGAGLTMMLAPSIPWVMADPVSLRALLLGAVAAVTLFLGLYFKLKAPVVLASLVLAGIAVLELGPYLLLISRWVLLGVFGILFAGVGATWEARVNNGKAVVAHLGKLR